MGIDLSSVKQLVARVGNLRHKNMSRNQKIFLGGFFGFIGFALVFSLVVGVYRVYAQTKTDRFTVGVASLLRLPIAKVNGERALYADYVDDLRAITVMRDFDRANNGEAGSLTDDKLSDQVLFRQVNNILIKQLAKKKNIIVEQKDIDRVKTDILEKDFKTLEGAEKAIMERYGWTLATFEKKVIVPFVLQGKLSDQIKNDPSVKDALRLRAQSVLDQIKAGADFAELAGKYGEDGTAANGGDLGWFGKGEMVPEFETVAFALKKGELAQELVESRYGFHILQTMELKTEKVKDEKGKLVPKATVKARHILFMFPTIDRELSDSLKKATIKVYGKVNNPFADLLKNENN